MRNARQLKKEVGEQEPFKCFGVSLHRFAGCLVGGRTGGIDHAQQRAFCTGKFRITRQYLPSPSGPFVEETACFPAQRP